MGMLARIASPADVRALSADELPVLAGEIRRFLIDKVSATGGHLGPNLGVVELTIALHRVFESPTDPIIWDTGHQSYVHKILTGRQAGFDRLRQRDGLSGYPDRAESPHDWTESSHASSSLSTADGLSKAFELTGADRTVVAVVGDGALTGGMCWEALNNITEGDRPVVIVVNDNGRSYAPTIGGLARHLSGLRLQPGYERALDEGRRIVEKVPVVGKAAFNVLHGMKSGLKEVLAPQTMFSDLGIKYVGPVDGHDLETLENALTLAKSFGGPVIVHAVTRKGMGYAPAENHEADQMHATGIIDPQTGLSTAAPAGADWTSVFADALVEAGERRSDVVAITAAMPGPTGLSAFADRFPDRMFDVGIAEQHAVASASGLALGGLHPVVAVYSTFLNRAFDQLLMDVALLDLPMTMVLDRSGVTGPDGASHNGMWDLSLLSIVPGIRVAAPRDAIRLREEFAEALEIGDGPSVVRFAKGTVPEDIPALTRLGDGVDVLIAGEGEPTRASGDVLIVAVGDFAGLAIDTAERLNRQGITATVVDPRWVLPVPTSVVELAARHRLVVTVEDSGVRGGAGSAVAEAVSDAGLQVPVQRHGIPQRFLRHASRGEILSEIGLTAPDLTRSVTATVASMSGGPARLEGLADRAGR